MRSPRRESRRRKYRSPSRSYSRSSSPRGRHHRRRSNSSSEGRVRRRKEKSYEREERYYKRHDDRNSNRNRSESPHEYTTKKEKIFLKKNLSLENDDPSAENEFSDEALMMKVMGFSSFSSTKNKKVENNEVGTTLVRKPRKYRQYMNRPGGFNKNLDKTD